MRGTVAGTARPVRILERLSHDPYRPVVLVTSPGNRDDLLPVGEEVEAGPRARRLTTQEHTDPGPTLVEEAAEPLAALYAAALPVATPGAWIRRAIQAQSMRSATCPRCGARVGERCRILTGRPTSSEHAERYAVVRARGHLTFQLEELEP